MIPNSIRSYLAARGVAYRETSHRPVATAQETASCAHVSGKRFAKTVVIKRNGQFMLVMLPAHEWIDLAALRAVLGGPVELATEAEFKHLFPECEAGAMPPLGGLYGLPVVAHSCMAGRHQLALNGGTHTDLIELEWDDFVALERPRLIEHQSPQQPETD